MPEFQSSFIAPIHLLGFLTGAVLYGMLAAMVVRDARAREAEGRTQSVDVVALATAGLGLVWNVGALLTVIMQDTGERLLLPWIVAVAFSALSFLPAVVVHSAVQALPRRRLERLIEGIAYLLSAGAAALNTIAASRGSVEPERQGLLLLTMGYGALLLFLAFAMRGEAGWRRALSAAGLAAFAVMAFHLSRRAPDGASWPVELIGHHASIPLALVILYQDYRFAFVDLFLKRAAALIAVVGLTATLYTSVVVRYLAPRRPPGAMSVTASAAIVALWVATATVYPLLRRWIAMAIDRWILRRPNYQHVQERLAHDTAAAGTTEGVLGGVSSTLSTALGASVTWAEIGLPPSTLTRAGGDPYHPTVAVLTAEPPAFELRVSRLAAGRRLLSDDLRLLETAAILAARRIDAIRVADERTTREFREQEILRLASEAELRALRAQLNPHFLFNALTTIGFLIREAPGRALETLYRLTDLLRAMLKRSDRTFTTLGDELHIVTSYLAIEQARFEGRLQVDIDVSPELYPTPIPPLLIQPLVENALKHGIAPSRGGGRVELDAHVDPVRNTLRIRVRDTGIGLATPAERAADGPGIGLPNIAQRLDLYYGAAAQLVIHDRASGGVEVELTVPLSHPSPLSHARTRQTA